MKSTALVVILGILLVATCVARAEDPDIDRFLARVEKGEAEEVRMELQSLLSRYPNNPGVLYLQGVLTTDGTEAVRIYQSIVDNFPKSAWADDALYKVYQFYYAIGLYRTAEIKLNQLRTDYPRSKYLAVSSSADTRSLPEEKAISGMPDVAGDTTGQAAAATSDSSNSRPETSGGDERGQ